MKSLPPKTIERLCIYRRTLLKYLSKDTTFIYSHELAEILHLTSVQVRRDLMLIGCSGSNNKGYNIEKTIESINTTIDSKEGQRIAIVGVGNLGQAIIKYFNSKKTKLKITAAFDVNLKKINKSIANINCYHVNDLQKIIKKENITIGIITVPREEAIEITKKLVDSGIKGVLNYTTVPINVPNDVFLEEYDMITSLEKVAFFAKR